MSFFKKKRRFFSLAYIREVLICSSCYCQFYINDITEMYTCPKCNIQMSKELVMDSNMEVKKLI